MFNFPKHLQDYIYEFDPTYRNKFKIVLYEFIKFKLFI